METKKTAFLIGALLAFVVVPSYAGDTGNYKNVAAPPPPPVFGQGWYFGIDMGANVYQDRGDDKTFTDEFGDTLLVEPKNDVGFYGGVKLGYVFGTGTIRPAVEADFFYNGFRGGADTTTNIDGNITHRSGTTFINTGAFMFNGILKFGNGRFQPYIGAGIGAYYAESAGVDLNGLRINPLANTTISTSGGASHGDFAFQVIAGADYYWNQKFSTFIEYHFLEYTSANVDTLKDRSLGQHLIGAGLRFHF